MSDPASPQTQERGSEQQRKSIEFYLRSDAVPLAETDMMIPAAPSPEVIEIASKFDLAGYDAGSDVQVLFRQSDPDGFSLVYAWFGPDLQLLSHSHNSDCMYYVISGSVLIGAREIRAGEGFFVPADRQYQYQAGDKGVEVLEFRHTTSFDIRTAETSESRWRQAFDIVDSHRASWLAAERPRQSPAF
jgi:mannose-6-phosphate isomerase-like protein (cupin superfamily)